MLKKVYCKNCKHIFMHKGLGFYDCWVYSEVIDVLLHSITGTYCLKYARKWYKFWIKD